MLISQNSPDKPHNHNHCIQNALNEARALCQKQGVNLTPLREKILTIVWKNQQPIGAYDILAKLANQEAHRAQPPTVYRILGFLQKHGLVHKLPSINSYIGCSNPSVHAENSHWGCFFICNNCRTTIEVDSSEVTSSIQSCASRYDFSLSSSPIELTGLCHTCSNNKPSHD
ncbi:MAG: Fur family transcriptional regulator [Candidatus Endonucleobacter sp. (ex Gigantidas childressi)]|nr:Fur family transcriptional regulator [Candidatus Endonucleobacter sp. (ex Gigantidas childressi)]